MDPAAQPSMLGEFRIRSVLGEGGSGIVYEANWGPRRVALKVLHPSLIGTQREKAQFLTEAQRLQQIAHPSVVKVFAVGELPDGRPYLAMEHLAGETLASVLARGALSLERALELFAELCSAMAALHAQGLVHRDLKPENVFVVENQHAVLLDFGIAKDITAPASTTTQEGNVRGTPAYMAPERFFGQPAGIATDIYELALILYVMLAARLPWDEIADPEARLQPRSLVELAPVPETLDVEIRRALSTRAQNRPASAMSLLAAVREAASGSATEPGPAETARLRSGAQSLVAPTDGEPGRAPSAKATTGQKQPTPLAWAPTVAAPKTRVRVRWPFIAAGVLAVIGGIAVYALVRENEPATKAAKVLDNAITVDASVSNDPWAPKVREDKSILLPLDEPAASTTKYRAEAAAALTRLTGDTRFILGVQLAELRAQSAMNDLLDQIAKAPKIAVLGEMVPPCVKAVASNAEWFVFGATSIDKSGDGTLVVRGRWSRRDVENCFGDSTTSYVADDGAKLFRVGDDGWFDFIDEHTAYIAFKTKLEPEALHKLVKRGHAPTSRAKQLYAALPAARSISIVLDGATQDDLSTFSLPRGSDIYGWVRVEQAGIVLDIAADPHNETAARNVATRFKGEIDSVFKKADPNGIGKLEIVRQKTAIHMRGNITALALGMVTAAFPM